MAYFFNKQQLYLVIFIVLAFLSNALADNSSDCKNIHEVGAINQCNFSKSDACTNDGGFVNYIEVTYCQFSAVKGLGVAIFVFWWLFLFVGLAVTADDFFCPALTVMAKFLHLSDNLAGVTLLAFGNGAPDIFSALAAVDSMKKGADAGLAFGALLGAGVFVTAVVAGAVIAIKPFHCMERPMLRDIIFYIIALFYTFCILYSGEITLMQAIGFLLIYVIYGVVVVLGRYIRKRWQTTPQVRIIAADEILNENNHEKNRHHERCHPHPEIDEVEDDPDLLGTYSKHIAHDLISSHSGSYNAADQTSVNADNESTPLINVHIPYSPLQEFLSAINPIPSADWNESRWYNKIYIIVKTPIQFLLLITCPIIDYDKGNNNWNRHLTVVQVFTGPIFIVFATNLYDTELGSGFPLYALFMIISVVLALATAVFTENETPPRWHQLLSFLGFIISVIWIYCIANEIVNILQMFGVIFKMSNAILGLTLLAWGNSIGDFIADTALARKGYPRIGISACFGGPLFNLLLGVGIPFTKLCLSTGAPVKLKLDMIKLVLSSGLMLSLLSTLVFAPLVMKFFLKRWYGLYLIILYLVFLVIAILTEAHVITVTL